MINPEPTQFSELNELLKDLVERTRSILGANFVGAYLVGSFAVGDADIHSDCDFLILISHQLTPDQEASLRALHAEILDRPGHWTQNIEGSYAVEDELRTLDGSGKQWLFVDHGGKTMEWSEHCNSSLYRWMLRERGVTLVGPDPKTLVDNVDPDAIRARMRAYAQDFLPDLATWIRLDGIAWAQRYAVTTLCRVLYTIETAEIISKKAALEWASDQLEPEWSALIQQALEGRSLGWNPADLPTPESVRLTLALAEYVKNRAAQD